MPYDLSNITKQNLLGAISVTLPGVWNRKDKPERYWFNHNGMLFSLRDVISLAYLGTGIVISPKHPILNHNGNWIANIAMHGLRISYRNEEVDTGSPRYWIAGTAYGSDKDPIPMLADFLNKGYWGTDHISSSAEGRRILAMIEHIKPNDRIALRKFVRATGKVEIEAVGTVSDITKVKDGQVSVLWDKNAPLYIGEKPSGKGAGNWWSTLLQLTRTEDIWEIFQEGNAECRLARIAWNTNGWLSPSGPSGKSKDKKLQEGQYHYGGEEWLFDIDKLVEGYHYGFLQPVRKSQDAFINKYYQVHLYTIDAIGGGRYYLGYVDQLEPISNHEADKARHRYVVNNWLTQLERQILDVGGISDNFQKKAGVDIFNVRFRPQNLHLLEGPLEIPADHPFHSYSRYVFTRISSQSAPATKPAEKKLVFKPSPRISKTELDQPLPPPVVRAPRLSENLQLHERMSKHLTRYLQNESPGRVSRESAAGYDAKRVDIIVRGKDDEMIYYEIKTYNSVISCIREAVGQLMEYALFPNEHRSKTWNIVTPHSLPAEGLVYLKRLREQFNLPFHYLQYDMEHDRLTQWV